MSSNEKLAFSGLSGYHQAGYERREADLLMQNSDQLSIKSLSWVHIGATGLYALSGAAMISASIVFGRILRSNPNGNSLTAALILAFKPVNLNGGLIAGTMVAAAVILTVLGTIMQSQSLLKTSFLVSILSILLTMAFGLSIWFRTMIERQEYFVLWSNQTSDSVALLQDRFSCCGYFDANNPIFVTSKVCSAAAVAAARPGCFLSFTKFADNQLRRIFTAVFGMAGFALISLLTGFILAKRISELERFRRIELKHSTL